MSFKITDFSRIQRFRSGKELHLSYDIYLFPLYFIIKYQIIFN